MADKTIGDLQAVSVGDLPLAPDIYDDTLIPVEQNGEAKHITGAQWKGYATAAAQADVERAVTAAANAEKSASAAETAADRAEAARDSIVLDEQKMAQAVSDAAESADKAAASEANAKQSETLAQSYAEQASVPAVAGVYNVVLTDRVTAERYALIVENGGLKLLGVSDSLDATELTLIDNGTGVSYAVVIESGKLILEEV